MIELLERLVTSGRIADLAIICLALELGYFWLKKSGDERLAILFNTLSGVSMLLALRVALTGANPLLVPLFLSTSFATHLIELRYRAKT